MSTRPFTSIEFRQALGQFATGVTVVTCERDPGSEPIHVHGMTASSFASVSLNPLLVLVCIDHNARMHPLIHKNRRFGISVLKENQQEISEFFAQPEQPEKIEAALGIHFRWISAGIPVLEDSLAQLACQLVQAHVAGDHTIFIAEVESADIFSGDPLLHHRGKYRRLAPPL
jgi:flavin reductase (DIM6/NTAB) family NADH-FMN oxidoreductase RutF